MGFSHHPIVLPACVCVHTESEVPSVNEAYWPHRGDRLQTPKHMNCIRPQSVILTGNFRDLGFFDWSGCCMHHSPHRVLISVQFFVICTNKAKKTQLCGQHELYFHTQLHTPALGQFSSVSVTGEGWDTGRRKEEKMLTRQPLCAVVH